jgi:TrmH family RNA methyltransferase
VKQLSSRDNSLFKALRALSEDPREVRRQRRTLLDGIHLVSVCIERGVPLRQLIVSEAALNQPEIERLIEFNRTSPDTDLIHLKDSLFSAISGVATPVGIAGVIDLPADDEAEIAADAVFLEAVQDAGNVGAILRSAAAAGIRQVVLGHGCAGAWTPRVLRAGQGAHFSVKIREGINLEAWLGQRSDMIQRCVATVVNGGTELFATDLRSPNIWLFGNEGAGLSSAMSAMAGRRVTIPMAAATESLNVAAAAAICLFEAVRQRRST